MFLLILFVFILVNQLQFMRIFFCYCIIQELWILKKTICIFTSRLMCTIGAVYCIIGILIFGYFGYKLLKMIEIFFRNELSVEAIKLKRVFLIFSRIFNEYLICLGLVKMFLLWSIKLLSTSLNLTCFLCNIYWGE